MRRLTIGIDASRVATSRFTGTERYSGRIVAELLEQGRDMDFRLYLNRRVPLDLAQRSGTIQRTIPFPRLWTHARLSAELAFHPVDVLFVPAHVVPPIHPRATVVTIHDLGYLYEPQAHRDWSRRYLDWTTRWSVRAANKIIAISQATKNDLIHFYRVRPDRVSVIYHGIDERFLPVSQSETERVRHEIGVERETRFILFVGTLQPRKNLVRLVEAFEKLADGDSGITLVLAGYRGWMMEDIDQAIASSRHRNRVILPGRIPDADLPALYSAAATVALPSLYEGFGLPALEAMACGSPVLVSNRGALPEVVGNAALIVDPLSSDAIAAGLTKLTDSALRAQLSKGGRERAKQFRWENAGRETLSVLRDSYASRKG